MREHISRARFLLQAAIVGTWITSIPRWAFLAIGSRHRYTSIRMDGASMLPTLRNGNVLKVDTTAYSHRLPRRGDIVMLPPPVPLRTVPFFVKRVIGLPGEVVLVQHGSVYINGHRLSEPYVQNRAAYFYPSRRVPPGSYLLLGDNRNNSDDSHFRGPVPVHKIEGKVVSH